MPSSNWVSLEGKILELSKALINDDADLASDEDSIRAVAFLILSSGAIEQYIEDRCRAVARSGIGRLKRSLPSASGTSLVTWGASKNGVRQVPIHPEDVAEYYDQYGVFLDSYLKSVNDNHGINAKDFYRLVYPIGIRTDDVPAGLPDKLQSLSQERDPAVHTTPRTRRFQHPPDVKSRILEIVELLGDLDDVLAVAETNFPLRSATP
ncbi:hypothetical protein [Isoptericola sp. b408]|uniref:hypothetical protein n=1 Tax=Isoptericola sp. b408 TaxID=3064653 RepID=UPI0027122CEF|nr:hypothetical protein [Isoptericola sp. b408]MDO8152118.1 hypothetical protein [Isoptericola sp. b408]